MEAGTFGYLNDFQICLCEQVFGVLNADICQVFNKADPGLLLKDIRKIRGVKTDYLPNLFQCQALLIILVDILFRCKYSFGLRFLLMGFPVLKQSTLFFGEIRKNIINRSKGKKTSIPFISQLVRRYIDFMLIQAE